MASFSYFYDSDQQLYELIKMYNKQLPHRPRQSRSTSKFNFEFRIPKNDSSAVSESSSVDGKEKTSAVKKRSFDSGGCWGSKASQSSGEDMEHSGEVSPGDATIAIEPEDPEVIVTDRSPQPESPIQKSEKETKGSTEKLKRKVIISSSCPAGLKSAGKTNEGRSRSNSRGAHSYTSSVDGSKIEMRLLDRMRSTARQQTSWVIVLVTMIVFIPIIGVLFSFGVFIPAIEQDFHVHKSVMGWIASIPVAFLTGANPLSCTLTVRFGYRPVIFAGVLLVVFGLFIVSASNHAMLVFVSYSVCVGVGVNFVYNSCMLLLLSYFSIDETQHNLTRACCIASFGFPLGLLVMNPLTVQLLNHYGWRVALRIVAMICFCDIIAVYVFIKPPQVNSLMKKYIPRNSRNGSVKRFIRRLVHRDLLLDPVLALWLTSVMCLWITLFFVPIHLVSDLMANGGMSSSQASFVLVVAGSSELAGRMLSAIVPNLFNLRASFFLLPACFCLSGSNCLFGFSKLPITEYAIIYGVCAGVTNATMIVACKEFFGNQYFHEAWTYSGIVYMVSVVLGNTLGGLPFDLTGKYEMVYKVFGAIHAYAFCILFLVNCIVFKREKKEAANRPLEQRQEVSAIYRINSSEKFPRAVVQKRFQRTNCSTSTLQSDTSTMFQYNNNASENASKMSSFTNDCSPVQELKVPTFSMPLKSSLRNSTSTVSPTASVGASYEFTDKTKCIEL